MITSHKVDLINNQGVLLINFDFSYEFGKFGKVKEEDIFQNVLNYIKEKQVKFTGKTIMLCASGIVFGTLLFNPNTHTLDMHYQAPPIAEIVDVEAEEVEIIEIEDKEEIIEDKVTETKDEKKDKEIASETLSSSVTKTDTINKNTDTKKEIPKVEIPVEIVDNVIAVTPEVMEEESKKMINPVTIYRNNGQIITLELEEYLIGVVAAEMPASFHSEALKAGVVAARTYTLKMIKEGKRLTDTEATQAYNDINQMKVKWGSDFEKYYNKIVLAVNTTKGIHMTYGGQYIDAVYHASNNGYTVSAIDVWGYDIPYLKSVSSVWDIGTSSYLRTTTVSINTINTKLQTIIDNETIIEIFKDNTNHVTKVVMNDISYTGVQFRNKLGLRSTDFDIEIGIGNLTIVTKGYGHGVGMSQYGANGMANAGYSYSQILNHYYKGIVIKTS